MLCLITSNVLSYNKAPLNSPHGKSPVPPAATVLPSPHDAFPLRGLYLPPVRSARTMPGW